MAEFPKLREGAPSNGGSTTMLSDCQRTNSSKGIFILANTADSAEQARLAAEVRDISRTPGHGARAGGSRDRADRGRPEWASLNPDERQVFNRWARAVLAFYSVIIAALLGAALVGDHRGGGKPAPTSVVERGAQASSVPVPWRAGK